MPTVRANANRSTPTRTRTPKQVEAEFKDEGEAEYDELSHPRAHASHHAGSRSGSRSISPAEILSGSRPNLPAGEKIPQCVRCVKACQKCTMRAEATDGLARAC
jgi:hypothetical protein